VFFFFSLLSLFILFRGQFWRNKTKTKMIQPEQRFED